MSTTQTSSSGPADISIVSLVNAVLRQRTLVAGSACLTALLVVTVAFFQPRSYLSTSAFMPRTRRAPVDVSGLAAQFGLEVPATEGIESPALYVDLLNSRQILGAAVDTRYRFTAEGKTLSGTLVDLYDIDEESAALRRLAAVRELGRRVHAEERITGVVALSVRSRYPPLAEQVNRRLLALLDEFNLKTRQSQAAAERRFTKQRMEEVKVDLRDAEGQQVSFLQRNRDFRDSPQLAFQLDRLAREVAREQQLYNALSGAYEQAKIEEVRDTPVMTVMEQPELPVRPEPRRLLERGTLALVAGSLLGVLLALSRDMLDRSDELNTAEFGEFATLRRATWDDFTHPRRSLGRLSSNLLRRPGGSSGLSANQARERDDSSTTA